MKKEHSRTITKADREAAERLKSIWLAMPDRPTQQAIADLWDGDANQSLISQYMNGNIALNFRAVMLFSRILGCEPVDIRSDLPEQRGVTTTADAGWEDVLGYGQAIGLGRGAEAQDYAETHKLKFKSSSLLKKRLNPTNLAVMYGDGDSMEPRIHPGDAILFDTSDTTPRDDCIFVILWKGEYFAKRCEILDGMVFFKADNPAGDHAWRKSKRMDAKNDPIQIIGRVRWIGSWEN